MKQTRNLVDNNLFGGLRVNCVFIAEDTKYKEVRVADFLQHVRTMHADGDNGFSVEFDDITSRTRTDLTADASFAPENKSKNRYVNISACK